MPIFYHVDGTLCMCLRGTKTFALLHRVPVEPLAPERPPKMRQDAQGSSLDQNHEHGLMECTCGAVIIQCCCPRPHTVRYVHACGRCIATGGIPVPDEE